MAQGAQGAAVLKLVRSSGSRMGVYTCKLFDSIKCDYGTHELTRLPLSEHF